MFKAIAFTCLTNVFQLCFWLCETISLPLFEPFLSANTFISMKSDVSFSYCGKPCHFTVVGVIGHDKTLDVTSQNESHSLDEQFRAFKIDVKPEKTPSYVQKSSRKFYQVTDQTKIHFESLNRMCKDEPMVKPFGGYFEQTKRLKDMLDLVLCQPGNNVPMFQASRGALIYGPTGCGKQVLSRKYFMMYVCVY